MVGGANEVFFGGVRPSEFLQQQRLSSARGGEPSLGCHSARPYGVMLLNNRGTESNKQRLARSSRSTLFSAKGGGNSMTNESITKETVQLSKSKQNTDPIASIRHPIVVRRILAATDLSPDGKKAVEYAIALAELFNSELTILHVYPPPSFNDYSRSVDGYSVADILRQNAQSALDSFRSEVKQEYPRTHSLLRCGKPEEQIVGAAKDLEVDLIVLSTHNYQWFSHLIYGSDAEGVLRHAPCPILVVRKEEHDFIDAN